MMEEKEQGVRRAMERNHIEMSGLLRDPVSGQRWVATRQQHIWCPPTDVYETDECIVVKVEVAGMEEESFAISLDGKKLTICGVRHDPVAKLAYQQMEIAYGHFESHVHLPRAIDQDRIEATYKNGFLLVHLPKAQARQVPVVSK